MSDINIKMTGRQAKKYKGIFGPMENVRVPTAIKKEVLTLIKNYKSRCIALAEARKVGVFDAKEIVRKLRQAKGYLNMRETLTTVTRLELFDVADEIGLKLPRSKYKRAEIVDLILDNIK